MSTDIFGLEASETADGSFDLRLVLEKKLDREVKNSYQLMVIAIDGGETARSGSMTIQVQVTDANDNSPTFTQTNYEVIFNTIYLQSNLSVVITTCVIKISYIFASPSILLNCT